MTKARLLFVWMLVFGMALGARPALADISDSEAANAQEGDNSSDATTGGSSASGDAVGGQVGGIVSSGDTSVDAKNRSEDADVQSGDAHGTNDASAVAGLGLSGDGEVIVGDIDNVSAPDDQINVQEGDNDLSLSQTASAVSGDAVGGQVIGAVTAAGGSADIVAENTSEDVDVETGESTADNAVALFVGLVNAQSEIDVGATDIDGVFDFDRGNIQEGDNEQNVDQASSATSGDGVAGQVLGVVSAGDTSLDASNASEDVDLESGVAIASSSATAVSGQAVNEGGNVDVGAGDISNVGPTDDVNIQEGDNSQDLTQAADAASGDAVGGQVAGVVTAAGGSADVVAENESEDVDGETGAAEAENDADAFTGLTFAQESLNVGEADIDSIEAGSPNIQEGDNDQSVDQTASAASGDGVGGQVLGVVSAGDTSLDASNRSEDVDLETGLARATNTAGSYSGLVIGEGNNVDIEDIEDIDTNENRTNIQKGDNAQEVSQVADASSGDGVGGQVAGIVTSAGGTADVVAANTSEDVDVGTGEANAGNGSSALVGLARGDDDVEVGAAADLDDLDVGSSNIQEGDNDQSIAQAATATSGDGVGGQVLGVVSAGDASLDARNTSDDVDVETGGSDAANASAALAGLASTPDGDDIEIDASDISNVDNGNHTNIQEGDNEQSVDQTADASSGDGVAGQVAGIVTSAGGSADVVADNASEDVDVGTGDADADNSADAFVGLAAANDSFEVGSSDIDDIDSEHDLNVQEGDNDQAVAQSATASTGDGVGGQVLGVVSAGDASLDARNRSQDVGVDTGGAFADNDAAGAAGLVLSDEEDIEIDASDITNVDADSDGLNVQEGDNEQAIDQAANATSGDGVAGQVAGIVTSAGGTADVVADNVSEDADATTGEATSSNDAHGFVGLAAADSAVEVGTSDIDDIDAGNEVNIQEGENSQTISQAADANSGDGVAGQVLGVVSAGDASVDARNRSEDVEAGSGDADADNDASAFVGLASANRGDILVADIDEIDIDDGSVQEGDNDQRLDQAADAFSGDAVAGQVTGAVVSAGGSADAVLDNASEDVDAATGDGTFENDDSSFVGEAFSDEGDVFVGIDFALAGDLLT